MLRRLEVFKGHRTVVGVAKVGKGRLVVSQLRVREAQVFGRKAQRIWALLQRNAGVRFDDAQSPLYQRKSQFTDEGGYIRRWLVLGVYGGVEPARQLAHDFVGGEERLEPRKDAVVAGKKWAVYESSEPGVNMRAAFDGQLLDNVAAYAGVWVHSPTARDIILDTPDHMVDLHVGSDDGVRVWLNGEEILNVDQHRPWKADENHVSAVKLRRGWNRLVIKVTQRSWEWAMSARFLSTAGNPISDLSYGYEPVD